MEWLEQNLDAYRILGETLSDLRQAIQKSLHELHGSDWFRKGIPTSVFDRLVSVKEGETAIDWYDSEYQQIMDFAVFPDLFEILETNGERFPHLLSLVPSSSLLQARFLELEVLRTKIGRARPVSEAELNFLMKFHTRFRQALIQHRESQGEEFDDSEEETAPDLRTDIDEEDVDIKEESSENANETANADEEATADVTEDATTKPHATIDSPRRKTQSFDANGEKSKEAASDAKPEPTQTVSGQDQDTLVAVLEKEDSMAILRHLFREVTNLAESLWSSDMPPHPAIWSTVRTSNWYEKSFSTLGLKPLSDFYGVINEVERRMADGLEKKELQILLEEANFAQVLLALRDMFQRNRI